MPHLTLSRRRRGAAEIASAAHTRLHRIQLPPALVTNCTPQPVPCCVAQAKRFAHSLCSWWRAKSRGGSTAAWRAHGAFLRSDCMLPERAFLTARLPSCTAHPVTHTIQRHTPHGCRCRTAAARAAVVARTPHAHADAATPLLRAWHPSSALLLPAHHGCVLF